MPDIETIHQTRTIKRHSISSQQNQNDRQVQFERESSGPIIIEQNAGVHLRTRRFNDSTKTALARLLQAMVADVSAGKDEPTWGWLKPDELNLDAASFNALRDTGLVESNAESGVRIRRSDWNTMEIIKRNFETQFNQLQYYLDLREDKRILSEAETKLESLSGRIEGRSEGLELAVSAGLWKMLVSSGMPARVDDVLNEGYSPEEWARKSMQTSPHLALGLSSGLGEHTWSEVADFYCSIELPAQIECLARTDPADVAKVRHILRWDEVECLSSRTVNVGLGTFWLLFSSLSDQGSLPVSDECLRELFSQIWSIVEELTGASRETIEKGLVDLVRNLDRLNVDWAADILRFPEVC